MLEREFLRPGACHEVEKPFCDGTGRFPKSGGHRFSELNRCIASDDIWPKICWILFRSTFACAI